MIPSHTKHHLDLNFYVKAVLLLTVIFTLNANRALVTAKENKQIASSQSTKLLKKVIDPEKFSGQIAAGYKAAQDAANICSKLFCYCGCDLTDEHLSLLDCFTSMHGVDCAICQEEAVIARDLNKQGKSLAFIQQTIDEHFSSQYPWDEASPALEQYFRSIKVQPKKVRTKYSANNSNSKKMDSKRHCCGH